MGELHPSHQLQILSATRLVENYVDYKYDSIPGYPFNKPVIKCRIEGVKLYVLLDTGADISVLTISGIVKNIKNPHLYQEDTAVARNPSDQNPDR